MRRWLAAAALAGVVSIASIVSCDSSAKATTSVATSDTGFVVKGDPASANGATWTYRGTVDGVEYDLTGVLLNPQGAGPFPAVVLSHGSDGNAAFLSALLGPAFVNWGLVVIAVNYTHASGVPIGAPGDATQPGASQPNILRAHMTRELLKRLGYVDMSRVALHGHSLGAYLGVAVAAAYPADFRVASHTAGGVRPDVIVAGPAPTLTEARAITIPFQFHHGDADATVPLSYDQRLDSLLTVTGIDHQFFVYAGEDHLQVRTDATMLARVRAWYAAHGMF